MQGCKIPKQLQQLLIGYWSKGQSRIQKKLTSLTT